MKTLFAFVLPAGRIGVATIGIVFFGMNVCGTPRTLAQEVGAAALKHKRSTYAALAEAPQKAKERKNPFAGDSQAVAAGGKLFEQHCADCHGKKAGGSTQGPSLLREEVQQATPGTLFWTLTNGVVRRGMPVWSKLPEPERWQIVTFLQSLNSRSLNPQSPNAQAVKPVLH
ncbi:MAG TPA: c-type cytochrome [Terriglobales bacterium]|nr:c-type cytochrome [Terriglobales bacterium]